MLHARALLVPAAAVALAAACASATPLSSGGSETRVVVSGVEGAEPITDLRLRQDPFVVTENVAAPRSALWSAVSAAYAEIGLPEPALDGSRWTAGLTSHTVSRRIGETRLSAYLECGSGMTGPNADTHRIRLTVQTAFESVAGGATRMHTRIDAVALSSSGVSSSPLPCASTGRLERRLHDALQARLR